jgi:methanogenic corrinoid protein MtbC1
MIFVTPHLQHLYKQLGIKSDLAAETVDLIWGKFPNMEKKYGPVGKKKCVDDLNYTLAFLDVAVENSSYELFSSYINWLIVLLESRGLSKQWLKEALIVLSENLSRLNPSKEKELAVNFLTQSLSNFNEELPAPAYIQPDRPYAELTSRYLEFLLNADRSSAWHLIEKLVKAGVTIKDIYLHIFQPAMYEVGKLWQIGQITPAVEHYCTAATQLFMSQLYPFIFSGPKTGKKFMAACVSGELHELGIRLTADLLEMEGWNTQYFGANTPSISLVDAIIKTRPELVGISCTIPLNVGKVKEIIQLVRNERVVANTKIIVGGNTFKMAPDLYQKIGADYMAQSAEDALILAASLV